MEYNTSRNDLVMKEYGRHIQKMIDYIRTIEDKEKRQQNAQVVIELMGFLNPHLKNVDDFRHKLWDHLFLISDFDLDVDSPYEIPTKESLEKKPERLKYPKRYPKFSHLGKNIELIINKAIEEENSEKKEGLTNVIANYMKLAYNTWHKENAQDDVVKSELEAITKGKLKPTGELQQQTFKIQDSGDQRGGGASRKGKNWKGGGHKAKHFKKRFN